MVKRVRTVFKPQGRSISCMKSGRAQRSCSGGDDKLPEEVFLSGGKPIMGEKQRIVIAEDHTILREGLRALLSSDPDFEIAGEAEDGQEAIRCEEKLKPHLVLMD